MMQIYHWCLVDDSALGRESLPGSVPMSSLAVPMMALCLCHQIETCAIEWSHSKATTFKDWAIGQMLNHVKVIFIHVFVKCSSTTYLACHTFAGINTKFFRNNHLIKTIQQI